MYMFREIYLELEDYLTLEDEGEKSQSKSYGMFIVHLCYSLHFWTDGFPIPSTPPMSFCHLIDKRLDPVEGFCLLNWSKLPPWYLILLDNWYLTYGMFAGCKSQNPASSQITIQDFHRTISALHVPITCRNAECLFDQTRVLNLGLQIEKFHSLVIIPYQDRIWYIQ